MWLVDVVFQADVVVDVVVDVVFQADLVDVVFQAPI